MEGEMDDIIEALMNKEREDRKKILPLFLNFKFKNPFASSEAFGRIEKLS